MSAVTWEELAEKMERKPYETVVRQMCSRDNVEMARAFLEDRGYPPEREGTRMLLSIFLLLEHEDDTFATKTRTAVEQRLQQRARDVLTIVRGNSITDFPTFFREYCTAFREWKSENVDNLITMLATTYQGHVATLRLLEEDVAVASGAECSPPDVDQDNAMVAQVRRAIASLEARAAKLGYSAADLLAAQPAPQPATVAVDEGVTDIARRAFWAVFRERLAANDYSQLRVILEEIRDRLKALTPNRVDLHAELNDKIEGDFIIPQIERGAYGPEQFHALSSFIVARLRSLEAPADNEATDAWFTGFQAQCAQGKAYSELLPTFFAWVYQRVASLERVVQAMRQAAAQPPRPPSAGAGPAEGDDAVPMEE